MGLPVDINVQPSAIDVFDKAQRSSKPGMRLRGVDIGKVVPDIKKNKNRLLYARAFAPVGESLP
jgi:hypothetical protein